jgi:tetratricopeptide (TPR) repeat protein
MLEAGLERSRRTNAEPSYALAAATLSLAQVYLELNRAEKAVEWLSEPSIGAYALTRKDSPLANRGNFRVESMKTALRAFAAAEKLDEAGQIMDALDKIAPAAGLSGMYLNLGSQLEQAWQRARKAGNAAAAEKAARGFKLFLVRLGGRPENETNFTTLLWVANQLMDIGKQTEADAGKLVPAADRCYREAEQVYRRIVNLGRDDADFAPQESALDGVRIQLSRCLRRQGRFDDAMNLLVELLKVRNNLLDAQREAALTYQEWAAAKKPDYYLLAIRGGRPVEDQRGGKTYLVWGWGGLARRTQFSPQHQEFFHEARYNLALCRLELALSKKDKEKNDLLREAEQDVLIIQRLRPDLGGESWYNQYDALLRRIQAELNIPENQRGLAAAEKKLAPGEKK